MMADKKDARTPHYWWWLPDLLPLFVMVAKLWLTVGFGKARLEFHTKAEGCIDPELNGLPIFRLKNDGAVCGEYDLTHVCPPFCD
jgi:hypothetical protein